MMDVQVRQKYERGVKQKKPLGKPLIPLPPTGFASFFCANPDVVQTSQQPKRTGAFYGRPAVSPIAKF
jgi:hypothetical protein